MSLTFYKYQGTGNDFIIIDNRDNTFNKSDNNRIALLCDRRFGIGADGLILLENHQELDFNMVYFNADGNESSMCGNGGRCIVAFAKFLGIIKTQAKFMAIDGLHSAEIKGDYVELKMQDVSEIKASKDYVFLDTGSPHHVLMASDLSDLDVKTKGSEIRYSELYGEAGSNVNFVEKLSDSEFRVRTYERGVEDETLSCGTGVTAVALAMRHLDESKSENISLKVEGGELRVKFNRADGVYNNIWLCGLTQQVFKGEI